MNLDRLAADPNSSRHGISDCFPEVPVVPSLIPPRSENLWVCFVRWGWSDATGL